MSPRKKFVQKKNFRFRHFRFKIRFKIDAGCYETKKNQTAIAVANKIESKFELGPEATVNNGTNVNHTAVVSRTSRTNNTKLVKRQN